MGDGASNPLANMPPWVWVVVLLGGGGTIGGMQIGGGGPTPVPVAEEATCDDAAMRAKEALAAWKGMLESYGLILTELGECRQQAD